MKYLIFFLVFYWITAGSITIGIAIKNGLFIFEKFVWSFLFTIFAYGAGGIIFPIYIGVILSKLSKKLE